MKILTSLLIALAVISTAHAKLNVVATLPDYAKGLDDRSTNTAAGLASSLRLAGTGSQLPLWTWVGNISSPTLVIAGDLDAKFTSLGRQLVDAMEPNAVFRAIEASGHAAHLEHPFAVVSTIRAWMTAIRQNPRARAGTIS